jgi:hypothetical protein
LRNRVQPMHMDTIDAARANELNLKSIMDAILALACQPAPASPPGSPARTRPNANPRQIDVAPVNGSLKDVSVDHLACLFRHWTWAHEAMARFERELANGWEYDEDPVADHPFGAYYHWCALLCGFSEAALERGLLPRLQLDLLREDLEAILPGLRACRQLLVVIPASLEEHPRIVDVLRDDETLGRLRRVHFAFGEALRDEQTFRQLNLRVDER